MAGEREAFVVQERIIPGGKDGLWRRSKAMLIREATLHLLPGEHRFRLVDVLSPAIAPQIGAKRVVTIQGSLAGCAIDNEGNLVEVGDDGSVKETTTFVTDRESVILQNVVPVTLNTATLPAPGVFEGLAATAPITMPQEPIPSTIRLGRITSITISSFPE